MREIRAARLLCPVSAEILKQISKSKRPQDAANIIARHSIKEAVAIIDNLDHLTAAFMVASFGFRARGDSQFVSCTKKYANALIKRAQRLRIRGTLGLCYARDQVYRDTGFFAGI